MNSVFERPTIGVRPPGKDQNDNCECDDEYNNRTLEFFKKILKENMIMRKEYYNK